MSAAEDDGALIVTTVSAVLKHLDRHLGSEARLGSDHTRSGIYGYKRSSVVLAVRRALAAAKKGGA